MILVNLGCGSCWHPAWRNLDLHAIPPFVRRVDLRHRLPFDDASCDAVYHSHVIEHLPREDAARLVGECFRIVKPGGIVRVAAPDLERSCRGYLDALERAAQGGSDFQYRWSVVELLDQTVREASGGEMGAMMRAANAADAAHIRRRVGPFGVEVAMPWQADGSTPRPVRMASRVRSASRSRTRRAREQLTSVAARVVGGSEGARQLALGRFRRSGEIHLWMYDRYSLARLLESAGFTDLSVREAGESRIAGFADHGLETLDGRPRKPDSLYMEGSRPV